MALTKRQQKIKEELERIRDGLGRITPEDVVSAAEDEDSALHDEFDWDDTSAAHKHRMYTARKLLTRFITVTVVEKGVAYESVVYVRDPRAAKGEQGYIAVTYDGLRRDEAQQIVLAELKRCEANIERARGVTAFLNTRFPGLSDELQSLLEHIVGIRSRFAQAAE